MKQRILYHDAAACKGCQRCILSCSLVNEGVFSPHLARVRLMPYPGYEGRKVAIFCRQCDEAFCEMVCPMSAISKDEGSGTLKIDHHKCIGCLSCVVACFFGAITVTLDTRRIFKCELCDGDPRCVEACRYDALRFVDMDELSRLKSKEGLKHLMESERPDDGKTETART